MMHISNLTCASFGPKPKMMKWAYTGIVRPSLTYGAICWSHELGNETIASELRKINRLAINTFCFISRSTPTRLLENSMQASIRTRAFLRKYTSTLLFLQVNTSTRSNNHSLPTLIRSTVFLFTVAGICNTTRAAEYRKKQKAGENRGIAQTAAPTAALVVAAAAIAPAKASTIAAPRQSWPAKPT